jgi:hypothetical protein
MEEQHRHLLKEKKRLDEEHRKKEEEAIMKLAAQMTAAHIKLVEDEVESKEEAEDAWESQEIPTVNVEGTPDVDEPSVDAQADSEGWSHTESTEVEYSGNLNEIQSETESSEPTFDIPPDECRSSGSEPDVVPEKKSKKKSKKPDIMIESAKQAGNARFRWNALKERKAGQQSAFFTTNRKLEDVQKLTNKALVPMELDAMEIDFYYLVAHLLTEQPIHSCGNYHNGAKPGDRILCPKFAHYEHAGELTATQMVGHLRAEYGYVCAPGDAHLTYKLMYEQQTCGKKYFQTK